MPHAPYQTVKVSIFASNRPRPGEPEHDSRDYDLTRQTHSHLPALGDTIEESPTDVIAEIEAAFTDAPPPRGRGASTPGVPGRHGPRTAARVRPLARCPGDVVVSECAALAFLSPPGFRHFIPAYMVWVLRHPEAPDAVVDSVIWALHDNLYGDPLDAFARSKWSLIDSAQRRAVGAFLQAMIPYHPDATGALAEWEQG